MGHLEGAFALVTGSTAGIGLAIAQRFVAEGAHVVVTGRDQVSLDAALERLGPRAVGVRGDAASLADLDRLTATVRDRGWTLDVLVANAGGGSEEPLERMTPEVFDAVSDLNVRGTFFTVQKALPLLADGARIVLVSSISGSNGDPGHSVYNASKAAVRSFARTMTNELRDRQIRVNARARRCRAASRATSAARRPCGASMHSCRWDGWDDRRRSPRRPCSSPRRRAASWRARSSSSTAG